MGGQAVLWQLDCSCWIGHQQHSCQPHTHWLKLHYIDKMEIQSKTPNKDSKLLNHHPMSASYPQESGKLEFRKMLKFLKDDRNMNNQVETQVEYQENKDSLMRTIQAFLGLEDKTDLNDIDEVDGRTEEILQPFVKLYFLKILLENSLQYRPRAILGRGL